MIGKELAGFKNLLVLPIIKSNIIFEIAAWCPNTGSRLRQWRRNVACRKVIIKCIHNEQKQLKWASLFFPKRLFHIFCGHLYFYFYFLHTGSRNRSGVLSNPHCHTKQQNILYFAHWKVVKGFSMGTVI